MLERDIFSNMAALGVSWVFWGDFPNIQMNTVPHLRMVQFIESAIEVADPDIVVTHHLVDTSNDHLQTSLACRQAVVWPFRRRTDVKPLKEFWYMEVPSATDWRVNWAMLPFTPNTFIEVGWGVRRNLMIPFRAPETED